MKKLFCISFVVLMLLGCLTACNFNFNSNLGGAMSGKAESEEKVDEMLLALSDGDITAAKALLHSDRSETSDDALNQIADFLDGRTVSQKTLVNVNVTTSAGTAGKLVQEQATYRATLNDGAVIYLNTVYLQNETAAGFVSFQLILGLV